MNTYRHCSSFKEGLAQRNRGFNLNVNRITDHPLVPSVQFGLKPGSSPPFLIPLLTGTQEVPSETQKSLVVRLPKYSLEGKDRLLSVSLFDPISVRVYSVTSGEFPH